MIPVTGGLQPRAAVGYMTVAALEVAALCGVGPRCGSELDVAAEHLEELVEAWGPDAPDEAEPKVLARALHGSVPVLFGAGLTTPLAYRWKTQINENAKQLAYAVELPEADHNEIVGWVSAAEHGRFAAVFLDDADTHPRVKARIELTGADRRRRRDRRRAPRRVARLDRRRARALARAARRPRLALPGGAARRRPDAGAGHRAPQDATWGSPAAMRKLLLLPITLPSAWRAGAIEGA